MRKTIAIAVLLLANIALLAHGVVPHHHHEGNAGVFFDSHYDDSAQAQSDTHNHNESCCHTTHNHHSEAKAESCTFTDFYASADNATFKLIRDINSNLWQTLLYIVPSVLNSVDFVGLAGSPIPQKAHLISYLSSLFSISVGLRAPPIC